MTEEELLKIVIGVVSAFAGWILAQLTNSFKSLSQRRKVRRLLLEELSDIDKELDRLILFYTRNLQMYGAQCIGNKSAAGLSNPIFKCYYKDALLSLNQNQRISYQMIHSLVDMINVGIYELCELSSNAYTQYINGANEKEINKLSDTWGKKVKAEFLNCAALKWQVRFHLIRKDNPALSLYTEDHRDYLRYLKSAQDKAKEYITNGKTIDPCKFDEIYDPMSFSNNADHK